MTYGFDPSQGLIIVPVRLFGPIGDMIVRLALDTGATSTLINSEIMILLGYDPATSPNRIQVTTGSGVELCPRVTVQRLEALGKSINDFPIQILVRICGRLGLTVIWFLITTVSWLRLQSPLSGHRTRLRPQRSASKP